MPEAPTRERLDPRTRVVCALALAIALVATQSLLLTGASSALILAAAASHGRAALDALRLCAAIAPVAVLIFVLQVAIGDAPYTAPLGLSAPGTLLGAAFALRLLAIAVLTWLVGAGTSGARLALGLAWLLAPLRALRVPVSDLARAIALALEYLPLLQRRQRLLEEAWRARGLPEPRGLRARLARRRLLLSPLLATSFRTAHQLEDALRVRGLTDERPAAAAPTTYRRLGFGPADLAALCVCGAIAFVSVAS